MTPRWLVEKEKIMALNIVAINGRISQDIRASTTKKGRPMVRFNVAVQRNRPETGTNEYGADFPQVIAFDKSAEWIYRNFQKGSAISITGHIATGHYTDKNGNEVYTTDIVSDQASFAIADSADARQNRQNGGNNGNNGYNNNYNNNQGNNNFGNNNGYNNNYGGNNNGGFGNNNFGKNNNPNPFGGNNNKQNPNPNPFGTNANNNSNPFAGNGDNANTNQVPANGNAFGRTTPEKSNPFAATNNGNISTGNKTVNNNADPFAGNGEEINISDDDLPF